ncbi:MAG: 50S ribosomal protein L9 [Candidatus Omnitrophica bacterium]|nr:50S ribosomal protein L9 [Candidatus Omnitrophota bacterium]
MEILLTRDVDKVGKAGETVSVKDGYARNFLIPSGAAVPATGGARAQIESQRERQGAQAQALVAKAQELKGRLEAVVCGLSLAAGSEEKLHGAVTAQDIVEALAARGIGLDKHQVVLERPINRLGDHEVSVKLHPEVSARLKVQVVKK